MITVTKHAIERLKERFYWTFPASTWSHRRITENVIIGQVMTATKCFKWKTVPFYHNFYTTKHGPNIEFFYKSGVYYACRVKGKKIHVLTAFKTVRGEY